MPIFKEVTKKDIEYYLKRRGISEDDLLVSKEFFSNSNPAPQRYVYKQIEGNEELEVSILEDELVLKSSPKGRDQVVASVFGSNGRDRSFVVQKYRYSKPVSGKSVSFTLDEWNKLLEFLEKLKFIDFTDSSRFKISQNSIVVEKIVSDEDQALLDTIKSLKGGNRSNFLESLTAEKTFTENDLNVLSGRKAGLKIFKEQLYEKSGWKEPNWQEFFKDNPWIFGHGLDYRFLSILNREASVSDVDLDGKDTVKADYLLGANDFTVLVEMKEPNTPLFRGKKKIRSRTWGLSTELMDAVSQILVQKSEWLVNSQTGTHYDEQGGKIKQNTIDPKAILVVGMKSSIIGTDREIETKLKTFELFRRDSRNVEIVTYDELYKRAFYIVNQTTPEVMD